MSANYYSHSKAHINKINTYAKKHLTEGKATLITNFIKLLYAHMSSEDINERSISDLYSLALSFWELMYVRKPRELKVRVFNPQYEKEGWQSKHTIIQVVSEDMPFIIDSMRMELNRLGLTTHLMIHTGGIRVVRDAQGQIVEALPYSNQAPGSVPEAPIYMEIDKQTDELVLKDIAENLKRVLNDVRVAVEDWGAMRERMAESIRELKETKMSQKADEIQESAAFLQWLLDDNFTFLGVRDYEVVNKEGEYALHLIHGSGLGVLRNETHSKVYRRISELPEQARELMLSKDQILLISQTNTVSTVHRPGYTVYLGSKRFNEKGELIGERRFIGLFTSTAYNTNPESIPLLRRKVAEVLRRSRLPEKSHSGKDLKNILATLPRDDLLQATVDELYDLCMGIMYLQERRQIRLFVRRDAYNRFVSCLVYIPRENFNTDLVAQMQNVLQDSFGGREVSLTIHFSESILARVHYVIRFEPERARTYDLIETEAKLRAVGKSWQEGLHESVLEYFGEERGNRLLVNYQNAFPAGYRENFSPSNAVFDIENIQKIVHTRDLGMSFYRPPGAAKDAIKFKLYRADFTVPLSDALPMLENMGLRVIEEQPYQITLHDGKQIWINDFSMIYAKEPTFEVDQVKGIFQEAFNKIWLGEAENDAFNRLVLEAQLSWREVSLIRGYAKYLRQIGFTFSQQYIAETFITNAAVSKLLIELFKFYFDPAIIDRKVPIAALEAEIYKKLDSVAILDQDRILRRFIDVIRATLRTNYFQIDPKKGFKSYLSFKFDSKKIPELPLPIPKYEIFIYSPRFEGVHLRAGKIARGGIRWSDRREDFRTEILGLMKAQQVKNALIVPAGAKGGFVPKALSLNATREEVLEEGLICYQEFISALLELTDNLVDDQVVHPAQTVCYDDADTYLVVAADKGTATFSDVANAIALEKNFWLGDAFASGGSSGYDHKKMGITARGAWVAAERHFQDLGINVDETEISVIGIGDMSGDVFGNGMLMSRKLKLVAAFNHQHIFLDPNPDPEKSYEERARLFALPRSNWSDYNPALISPGGGVYSRNLKAITISPEIKQLLDIDKDVLVPNELIRAILKAPVDLIWNGGIGTFVKATQESNIDVGDRTNDGIRVNGNELRARVVCEGGNLGFTQLARVEYSLNNGKINTDFIDNSAGVDCSDHEVNIKIFLNAQITSGDLTLKQRNQLLLRMTDEVASLVLQNNYQQNLVLSLVSYKTGFHINLYARYIEFLNDKGKLNRSLEYLPDQKTIMERKAAGIGLTRPELAILLSYTKINLTSKIRKSSLTSDPYLSEYVKNAFPTPMRKRYGSLLLKHRLSSDIIATQISNQLVSEMGILFIYRIQDETNAPVSAIVKAYSIAREIFHLEELNSEIESLDYKVDATIQYRMLYESTRLVRRATRWLIRNSKGKLDITKGIQYFSEPVEIISKQLPKLLLETERNHLEERRDSLVAANVSPDMALRVAKLSPLYHSLNIIEAKAKAHQNVDIYKVAKIYFTLVEKLDLIWFRDKVDELPIDTRWMVLAKSASKADLDKIQRALTASVLRMHDEKKNIQLEIEEWFTKNKIYIDRWNHIVADIRHQEKVDFTLVTVAIRELENLAHSRMMD